MEENIETTSKQESEIEIADNSPNNATLSSKSSNNDAEIISNDTASEKENLSLEQSPISNKSENTDEDKEILNLKRKITEQNIREDKKSKLDECLSLAQAETTHDVEMTDDKISVSDDEEYYLTISNLPVNWTYFEIKNYLDTECGPVDEIEILKDGKIRLTFQTLNKCKQTLNKLHGKDIRGMKVIAEITELSIETNKNIIESTVRSENTSDSQESDRSWRPDIDVWDIDPQGLYGLRPEFLKSLDITPPLDRWVDVSNFRCEKADLRDVMELAGQVIMCCVVAHPQKYAKVMFSHPLEAVQAIAMLNGQLFYGQPLKVCMFRNPGSVFILPKGLSNIGIGLGSYGKPLRNIVHEFRRFVSRQSNIVNPLLFSKLNDSEETNEVFERTDSWDDEIKRNIDVLLASAKTKGTRSLVIKNLEDLEGNNGNKTPQNEKKTVVSNQNITQTKPASPGLNLNRNPTPNVINMADRLKPPFGPPIPNNIPTRMNNVPQRFPRPIPPSMPMRPRPGPMNGPRPFMPGPRPFSGPFGPQTMPGPFVPRPPMQPGMNFGGGPNPIGAPHPRPGHMPQGNKVTVEFKNLPPSTTFPVLCEKLSHCGQVMSVQLTTPGCAIATFGHPSHADRCYQTYNRMNVEGYILDVQYV